jgi:hypothetical protein
MDPKKPSSADAPTLSVAARGRLTGTPLKRRTSVVNPRARGGAGGGSLGGGGGVGAGSVGDGLLAAVKGGEPSAGRGDGGDVLKVGKPPPTAAAGVGVGGIGGGRRPVTMVMGGDHVDGGMPGLEHAWGQDHGYSGMSFSIVDPKGKGDKSKGGVPPSGGVPGAISAEGLASRSRLNSADFGDIEQGLLDDIQKQYSRLAAVREEKSGDAEEDGRTGRLLVVSHMLPFKLHREDDSWKADELERDQLHVPYFDMQSLTENNAKIASCLWVGWPGVEVDDGEQSALRDQLKVRVPRWIQAMEAMEDTEDSGRNRMETVPAAKLSQFSF